MKRLFALFVFLSTVLFLNAEELSLKQVEDIAMKANKEVTSEIKKGLKKAKRRDGLNAMVEFCINDSKKLIQKVDKRFGENISIKRISFNNRNEDAKVLDNEKNILKAFELIQKADAYEPNHIVQIVDDNRYKVYFPIKMKSRTCKNCHGSEKSVDNKVKKRFFDTYKNNNGYGYKSGEIRGALVVSISE